MKREVILGISSGTESAAVAINTDGDLLHKKILNHSWDQNRVAEIAEYLRRLEPQLLLVVLDHDFIRDWMKAECRKQLYNMGKYQGLLAGANVKCVSFLTRQRWKHWIECWKFKSKSRGSELKEIEMAIKKKFPDIDFTDGESPNASKGVMGAYASARMGLWLALDSHTTEYKICTKMLENTDHAWPII